MEESLPFEFRGGDHGAHLPRPRRRERENRCQPSCRHPGGTRTHENVGHHALIWPQPFGRPYAEVKMAPRARVSGLPEANGQKTTLRAAGPRTHVTSIVNGFTRPDAAAFGPLGNIGNAAQSAVGAPRRFGSPPAPIWFSPPPGSTTADRPHRPWCVSATG
jgi:hypothetical protein